MIEYVFCIESYFSVQFGSDCVHFCNRFEFLVSCKISVQIYGVFVLATD